MKINALTAELCGIILGDGNLHKIYNRISISGSRDDLLYFQKRVIPLFYKAFGLINPRIVRRKDKRASQLEIKNKNVFEFFISQFDLKRGPKD